MIFYILQVPFIIPTKKKKKKMNIVELMKDIIMDAQYINIYVVKLNQVPRHMPKPHTVIMTKNMLLSKIYRVVCLEEKKCPKDRY
jgi:hypothetical protein